MEIVEEHERGAHEAAAIIGARTAK
jgi:hypothetical protein